METNYYPSNYGEILELCAPLPRGKTLILVVDSRLREIVERKAVFLLKEGLAIRLDSHNRGYEIRLSRIEDKEEIENAS